MKIKSDKKQLIINLAANILSYSANIIISFILTPYLIDKLGKETYSFYPIANSIVSYLSVLMNALNTMASRFVTVSLVKKNNDDANKYFSSALATNGLLSMIVLIPMSIIIIFLEGFMDVPINSIASIKLLFILVFSSAIINIMSSVLGIATFAKNRIDLRSLRELCTAAIKLVIIVVMYKFLPPSLTYIGFSALACAIVGATFQYKYTKMLLPEIKIKLSNISLSYVKEMFSASIWNATNSFGAILLSGTIIIFSNILYSAEVSGIYSIANTVPQFINGIISVIAGVFYPVIMQKYAKDNKKELIKELNNAQSCVGLIGCAVISVFAALSEEFFRLWTPGENSEFLSTLTFWVILPHTVMSCAWSLTNLNIAMNKVKVPAIFLLGCSIINIFLAVIMSKGFDCSLHVIIAVGSIIQLVWIGGFIPLYASHNLGTQPIILYKPIIKGMSCTAAIFLIVSFAKQFIEINSWIKFIIIGGIFGLFALIIFALVMFGFGKIKAHLRFKNKYSKEE